MATTRKLDWKQFLGRQRGFFESPAGIDHIIGYGPQELHLRENVIPSNSPEMFVRSNAGLFATGSTSRDEGYFFWGLLKVVGPEGELSPLGLRWYYQSKVAGGMTRVGGSVVDFLVQKSGPGPDLGIRIVTPHFHTQAGPFKVATDFEQMFSLLDNNILPVDVFSQNYINDITGGAVISSVKRAIEARPDYSPIYDRFMGVDT